jgi:ribosome-associated translation inhibitor RaiA
VISRARDTRLGRDVVIMVIPQRLFANPASPRFEREASTFLRSQSPRQESIMLIQVNTDRHIEGHEALTTQVREAVESALRRNSDQITRVEVHLSDENAQKSGPGDKRCVMEARLEGRQPVAVTHDAATLAQAIDGAAEKLSHLIQNTLERLRDQRRQPLDRPVPEPGRTDPS